MFRTAYCQDVAKKGKDVNELIRNTDGESHETMPRACEAIFYSTPNILTLVEQLIGQTKFFLVPGTFEDEDMFLSIHEVLIH